MTGFLRTDKQGNIVAEVSYDPTTGSYKTKEFSEEEQERFRPESQFSK